MNAKGKMQNAKLRKAPLRPVLHFAFCILHFAFAFIPSPKGSK
jgi:hypothetical protein